MALIKCPECGKDISEYAIQCGYCFYPLKEKSVDTAAPSPKPSRIRNGNPPEMAMVQALSHTLKATYGNPLG